MNPVEAELEGLFGTLSPWKLHCPSAEEQENNGRQKMEKPPRSGLGKLENASSRYPIEILARLLATPAKPGIIIAQVDGSGTAAPTVKAHQLRTSGL